GVERHAADVRLVAGRVQVVRRGEEGLRVEAGPGLTREQGFEEQLVGQLGADRRERLHAGVEQAERVVRDLVPVRGDGRLEVFVLQHVAVRLQVLNDA